MPADPRLITPRQFSEITGLSRSTIFRLVKRDGAVYGVPALRAGDTIKFSREQLEDVIAGKRGQVAS